MVTTLDVVETNALDLIDMMLEENKRPPAQICLGPPGTGKTHMYKNLPRRRPALKWVKVLQLPLYPPEDLRGFIHMHQDPAYGGRYVSESSVPKFVIPPPDAGPGVLVFDDFNISAPAQQALLYRVIHEGMLGEHELPEQTFIGLTGNEAGQKAVANRIPSTVINRTEYHDQVRPDPNLWLEWAGPAGVHPFITTFIGNVPHKLYEEPKDSGPFTTPRSLELMNRVLTWKAKKVGLKEAYTVPRMSTFVGEATANELWLHTKYERIFEMVRKVESGTMKPNDPEIVRLGADEKYILSMGVAQSPNIKTPGKYKWFIEAAAPFKESKDIALFGIIYTARSLPDGESAAAPFAMDLLKTFGGDFAVQMKGPRNFTAGAVDPKAVTGTGKKTK